MAIKSGIDTSSMTSSHPLVVVPRYLATSRSNTANKAIANSDHSAARSSLDLFLAGKLQISALCLSYAITVRKIVRQVQLDVPMVSWISQLTTTQLFRRMNHGPQDTRSIESVSKTIPCLQRLCRMRLRDNASRPKAIKELIKKGKKSSLRRFVSLNAKQLGGRRQAACIYLYKVSRRTSTN
ncbi:hypothetical protein KC328_g43 [Hortaea werneckii]|nr:hypothetical protein KC328_g43 [Hortaea werneckii]